MAERIEEKIDAVLNNPELMQKIVTMAQSMGSPQQSPGPQSALPQNVPEAAMLQRLGALAQQSGIDGQQQALLKALSPYLSKQRISKLESAMRAAKMTRLASSLLGSGMLK